MKDEHLLLFLVLVGVLLFTASQVLYDPDLLRWIE
jgi:hypothetical protein